MAKQKVDKSLQYAYRDRKVKKREFRALWIQRINAAVREHGHGEFRLKWPMKLVNGKYQRISWDQALNEISARMLELRKQSPEFQQKFGTTDEQE